MRYANAWYIGDRAQVRVGGRNALVTVRGFKGRLVDIEHPDGLRSYQPFTTLVPPLEQDTRSYSILPTTEQRNYRDWLIQQGYAA